MGELNEKAKKVFQLKYAKSKSKTWKETCERVADHISSVEKEDINTWKQKFHDMIYDFKFIPGGRILANSGTGIPSLANCFVLGIDDSRESIYDTLKDAAEVFAHGGGIGYNLSNIREEGAKIKTTDGKASGPLSFLSLFDQTGEVISQASRRGAQIGLLDISHPDVEHFIHFKSVPNARNDRLLKEYNRNLNGSLNGTKYYDVLRKTLLDDQLTHFNISVALTDDFMRAVEEDKDWDLISPSTKEVVKTVKAKELLNMIATQCWESGDPGVLFTDRINEDNIVPYYGYIKATNPCGEVPLFPGESCILGSLNLHAFYNKKIKDIDWNELKDVVKTATRFLEDVTEVSIAPVDFINQVTKSLRRLGLGVMGFADLLVDLNIPYDSYEAQQLARKLSWFISYHAWITSYELAKERGAFHEYDKEHEKHVNLEIIEKTLYNNPFETFEIPFEEVKQTGFRNVSVTSIAPTGSIAIIGGVNSGIEPFFALAYTRNITEGVGNIATDQIVEINPALENKLKEHGYTEDQIKEIVECAVKNGTLASCDIVSDELKSIFKTADEIAWENHIAIQASWQEYISNSISKTINCGENTTPEEIYKMYLYMWHYNLKGGTIYRNLSKSFQVLEKPSVK